MDYVLSVEQVATGCDTLVCCSWPQRNNQILQNDSAPCHTSLLVKNQIPTIAQPPYSPVLTLCKFRLFLELKMGLSRHWFAPMEEVQQNATSLRTIPEQDIQGCFQQRQDCWRKCVCAEVQYFRGDQVSFFTCPFY